MGTDNKTRIEIAAQLYRMRRTVRDLIGDDKFREQVEVFRPLFRQVETANKCSTLQAMHLILKTSIAEDPFGMLRVCAAGVEIMEPSLRPIAAAEIAKSMPATKEDGKE